MKEQDKPLPAWAKTLIGVGVVAALIKFTPILELMKGFLYFVLLPLVFVASFSVSAKAVLDMLLGSWQDTVKTLNKAVEEKMAQHNEKMAA
jgi:hypothetical protein